MTPPSALRGTAFWAAPIDPVDGVGSAGPAHSGGSSVWLPTALVRLAGASALVLLKLGEAATLAAAAGVRSVLDATQAPAAVPAAPPVQVAPAQVAVPPVEAPSVDLAPVEATPVDLAPVEATPVDLAPVEVAVAELVAEPVAEVVALPVEPPTSDVAVVHPEPTAVVPVQVEVEVDQPETADVEADDSDVAEVDVETDESEDSDESEEPEVDEPPVPLWDQLSLASIRGRLRGFSLDELKLLHAYEVQHSHRPQVVAMLEKRIDRVELVSADGSAGPE
jgi:hypothetical protein